MSAAVALFEFAGGVAQLGGGALRRFVRHRWVLGDVLDQIDVIGRRSLLVTTLTGVFSAMVITVQFAAQLARFGARAQVGSAVALSMVRELGPVLTALMVGGRVGAGIAAELGSMNVTEQIDALRSMGSDPIAKLVVPRIVATVVCLPLLTAVADVLGVAGAMGIARLDSAIRVSYFYNTALSSVTLSDFLGGLGKTVFFALSLSLVACHQGLRTRGGTRGVGRATTETVVVTSVLTLALDFVLTRLMIEVGL